MALTDYTTYNDIRAVLGVSDEELEDTTLALEVYSVNLSKEMRGVHAQTVTQYTTISGKVVGDRTAAEQQFYEQCRLFAVYAVAKQCLSSLPLFSPKDISDNKAAMSRFSDSPFRTTMKEVNARYTENKSDLAAAIATVLATSGTKAKRTWMATAKSTTDPVTG